MAAFAQAFARILRTFSGRLGRHESEASGEAATAPDAPTIGTATGGDTQASVTFTPPASDGGSAITGYTVTSSPGGLTGTGSASPITVTGLTNDVAYTFTVTATNAVGTSSASAASNSVTPTWPNLLANGTFDNSTGWVVPSNCTIGSGVFTFANTAANVTATHAITGAAGTYRVKFDIVTHASGNITMRFNSGTYVGTAYIDNETGTFTNDIVCAGAITVFEIRVTRDGTSMNCSVDNITIQKIA